jgi:hypothetical protein
MDSSPLGPARPPGIPPGPLPGGRYTPVDHMMDDADSPIDPTQRLSSATSLGGGPPTPSLLPLSPAPSTTSQGFTQPTSGGLEPDVAASAVPRRGASLAALQHARTASETNGRAPTPLTDSDSEFEDDYSPSMDGFDAVPHLQAPPEVTVAAASPSSPTPPTMPEISIASSSDVPDSPDPHASHLRRLMPQRRSQLRLTAYRDSTYDESDRNSRLRFSTAEDTGFAGIGLSLLQDLMGGGSARDSMSTVASGDGSGGSGSEDEADRTVLAEVGVVDDTVRMRRDTVSSMASSEAHLPFDRPDSMASAGTGGKHRSHQSSRASASSSANGSGMAYDDDDVQATPSQPWHPADAGHSRSDSAAPSLASQSDGMSIYDNYRYSVYSTMSKMSRNSFGSLAGGVDVPPMPEIPPSVSGGSMSEYGARPSMDRQSSTASVPGLALRSRKMSDLRITVPPPATQPLPQMANTQPLTPRSRKKTDESTATSSTPHFQEEQAKAKENLKSRPAPLELVPPTPPPGEGSPSPLLHTTFGSPLSTAFTDGSGRGSGMSSYSAEPESAELPSTTTSLTTSRMSASLHAPGDLEPEALSPARSDLSVSPNLDDFPQPGDNVPAHVRNSGVDMDDPSPVRLDATHIRPQFRSKGVQEVAAEVEARFSRASRASSTAGDGLPMREVGAAREPLPKIQVDSVHVSQMVFPAEPSPGSDIVSAVSPYPLSALPSFGASFHPSPDGTPEASPVEPAPPSPRSPGAGTFGATRTSVFLPHPNAPRARPRPGAGEEAGPLYGRKSAAFPDAPPAPVGPFPGSAAHAMFLARDVAFAPPMPGMPLRRPPPTIYALTAVELTESLGPVPVSFSLEPPNAVPAQRMAAQRAMTVDGATPSAGYANGAAPPDPALMRRRPSDLGLVASAQPQGGNEVASSPPKVIPRAGFQPKAPTLRPRSRSFSAVEKPVAPLAPAMPSRCFSPHFG